MYRATGITYLAAKEYSARGTGGGAGRVFTSERLEENAEGVVMFNSAANAKKKGRGKQCSGGMPKTLVGCL